MDVSNNDIKEIRNLLTELNENVRILINSNNSNKLKILEDKLRLVKRLDVNAVKKLLNCSHP